MDNNDEEKLKESINKNAQVSADMIQNWIGNLVYHSAILANTDKDNEDTRPSEGMFWIRLWGVLVELPEKYTGIINLLEVSTEEDFNAKYGKRKDALGAVYPFRLMDKINEMKSKLSEEELICIDNFRQTNCHLSQKGYQLWFRGKGENRTLKDSYTPRTVGREMKIDYIDQCLDSVVRAHLGNMQSMAIAINSKVKLQIDELWEIYKEYNT